MNRNKFRGVVQNEGDSKIMSNLKLKFVSYLILLSPSSVATFLGEKMVKIYKSKMRENY